MKTAADASAESYSAFALVRRLLLDEALGHWRRYAMALALMGVAAGATALGAYLIGTLTNEAYVTRNFQGIVVIGVLAMAV
ncbi:MAG TPA: ABC transporter ATP-binding protein, partial [Xanthobacteraceae bacterium]